MKANNIDIYKSIKLEGTDLIILKEKGAITYNKLPGNGREVNIVKCSNLSAKGFLDNNDINATGICTEVPLDEADEMTVHAHASF